MKGGRFGRRAGSGEPQEGLSTNTVCEQDLFAGPSNAHFTLSLGDFIDGKADPNPGSDFHPAVGRRARSFAVSPTWGSSALRWNGRSS